MSEIEKYPDGTTSPFLPGTNVMYAWDSTCLGLLKTCPRLYQYTMLDGYTSKSESVHLRFGIEYHLALQEYDVSRANGVNHEDAIHDVVANLIGRTYDWDPDGSDKAIQYKNQRTLISLVIDYLDKFENDPAETYIRSNGLPAVELSFKFELPYGPQSQFNHMTEEFAIRGKETFSQPYLLSGHLDRVARYQDHLFVMDRKTSTSTLGAYYWNQWEPNNQMTLYTLAGRLLLQEPIKGVIIDAAQVKVEEPNEFARGFTYRTDDQLEEWMDDLRFWLMQAEGFALSGHWPMNDTSCDKFGGCKFRGVCSKSPGVRHRFLSADFIKQEPEDRWNPLKSRG